MPNPAASSAMSSRRCEFAQRGVRLRACGTLPQGGEQGYGLPRRAEHRDVHVDHALRPVGVSNDGLKLGDAGRIGNGARVGGDHLVALRRGDEVGDAAAHDRVRARASELARGRVGGEHDAGRV